MKKFVLLKCVLFLLISLILMIELLLFKNSGSSVLKSQQTSSDKELTIWIQESFTGSETYFNELCNKFEETYPETHISFEIIKGSDIRAYKYMTNQLINGVCPDILLLSTINYNNFTIENRLKDLSDYITNYDSLLPSVINNGLYNNVPYGVAYFLDPEILIYNATHFENNKLTPPEFFSSIDEMIDYMIFLNSEYKKLKLSYCSLSIPSIISEGQFIRSLQGPNNTNKIDNTLYNRLEELYINQNTIPYNYDKVSTHPFFDNEVTFSIEPLSFVYEEINTNYNMNDSICVLPNNSSNINFSYSKNYYISIFSETDQLGDAKIFLDFFLCELEILNRYKYYGVPVISYELKDEFIKDSSYNNQYIWEYLESAFHYPISSMAPSINSSFDIDYNSKIKNLSSSTQGDIP